MSEVREIRIEREVPFFGEGDTLESRLRRVTLRGFPETKIYENANFETLRLSSEEIPSRLHTPQPSVYQVELDRVNALARLFREKGIDIFHLDRGYDYVAVDSEGIETQWTIIPPIVEECSIPQHSDGGFDLRPLIGPDLASKLEEEGWTVNPETTTMEYSGDGNYLLINDGTHRIHAGLQNEGITVLRIGGVTPGFPYYAVPQSYSRVKVHPKQSPETTELKKYVVTEPGQKQLYRLFPSGGIFTGDVRPPTEGENFK